MKKTYFIKTFNFNLNLFMCSILGLFLVLLSGVFASKMGTLRNFSPLSKIPDYFEKLHDSIVMATVPLILLLMFSIVFEIISRLKKDALSNYFKSIIETFSLRRFASQSERIDKTFRESQSKITVNPIYHDFNRAVKKSVVDITEDQVLVFFKIPHSQQAQKILKEMEELLREEISSRNPDYIFSTPERTKNQLWFTGTKR